MGKDAAGWVVSGVIGAVILFVVAAQMFPQLVHGLNNISAVNGLPLAGLFAPTGIIAILFVVALFYAAYKLFWNHQ